MIACDHHDVSIRINRTDEVHYLVLEKPQGIGIPAKVILDLSLRIEKLPDTGRFLEGLETPEGMGTGNVMKANRRTRIGADFALLTISLAWRSLRRSESGQSSILLRPSPFSIVTLSHDLSLMNWLIRLKPCTLLTSRN